MKIHPKHAVTASLVFFGGVALSLYILKKAQEKNVPVLSSVATAVAPGATPAANAAAASTTTA